MHFAKKVSPPETPLLYRYDVRDSSELSIAHLPQLNDVTGEGVKVAYVGDGNNVAYSWMMGASLMGMQLVIACPKSCQSHLAPSLGDNDKVEIIEDPFEAVKKADIIYTDVWISMGEEKDTENKKKLLLPYQINQKLVDHAKKDVMVMHCLPAHREMEITSEVLDGKHSIVFDQAENRLHVQKAILEKLLSPSQS